MRRLWAFGAAAVLAACAGPTGDAAELPGTTRVYYVRAEPVTWDYLSGRAPAQIGMLDTTGMAEYVRPGPGRIGHVYLKAQYVAYTDSTFRTRVPPDDHWAHLGLLGPALHAVVGDTMVVVFRNGTTLPAANIHAHGVAYDHASDGMAPVPPGGTRTYRWTVPERAGPAPNGPSSTLWLYHAHADEAHDTNAGLIGPLIVTRRGAARPDGTPADVDRELVVLFSIYNENESPYLAANLARAGLRDTPALRADAGFVESNLKHAMNGGLFLTLPGLTVRRGERVRWYLAAFGSETDLHTPHWHGNTVLEGGTRRDVVALLPATTTVADMRPDAVGTWPFHCHVADHMAAGMSAWYRVEP